MTIIFAIDLETSGLPPKGIEPGHDQYPWPVQVGAVLFEIDGRNRSVFSTRVRSDGRSVTKGASGVHGLSGRDLSRTGIPEISAINVLCHFAAEASIVTGYNVHFDRMIIQSSLIRLGREGSKMFRPGLQVVDLMPPSAAVCKLPSVREDGQYKWPKLDEAMAIIRREQPPKGHHDALRDAIKAKRLFMSLYHSGMLEVAA